jgi:hypothetical protein
MAQSEDLVTVAEIAAELKMNQQTSPNWIFSPEMAHLRCADWIRGRCVDAPFRRGLGLVRQ